MKRPPSARKSPPKKRGAKKATSISVRSIEQITAIRTRFQLEGPLLTYRDVWRQLNRQYGLNLSLGTVHRMAQGDYLPTDRATRRILKHAAARDYDGWLARSKAQIADILQWAETPKERL
jgi:hypothetical protein